MTVKERKKYEIKRKDDSEQIFDMYMDLCLVKEKASKIVEEMNILEKEMSFKKAKMWKEIEKYIGLSGKDINLGIDADKSDTDKMIIYESESSIPEFGEFLKRMLGGIK